MSIARRILARWKLARGVLQPGVKQVIDAIRQGDTDKALDELFHVAQKLGIRGAPRREGGTLSGSFLSLLDPADADRFVSLVQTVLAAKSHLLSRGSEGKYTAQQLLEDAAQDITWAESVLIDDKESFKHGDFTVYLTATASDALDEALRALDEVADKIRSKFPQVLYGKVYVRRNLRGVGSYDPRPGGGGMVAGAYSDVDDTISLSLYATPDRNSVMTLIHEFGHRYHTRFLKGDDRERFIKLHEEGDKRPLHFPLAERKKFAEEWLSCERSWIADEDFNANTRISDRHQLYRKGFAARGGAFEGDYRKFIALKNKLWEGDESVIPAMLDAYAMTRYGGDLRVDTNPDAQPVYASDYGRVSWQENFADAFLAFVLGRSLPEPLETFMRGL